MNYQENENKLFQTIYMYIYVFFYFPQTHFSDKYGKLIIPLHIEITKERRHRLTLYLKV